VGGNQKFCCVIRRRVRGLRKIRLMMSDETSEKVQEKPVPEVNIPQTADPPLSFRALGDILRNAEENSTNVTLRP